MCKEDLNIVLEEGWLGDISGNLALLSWEMPCTLLASRGSRGGGRALSVYSSSEMSAYRR